MTSARSPTREVGFQSVHRQKGSGKVALRRVVAQRFADNVAELVGGDILAHTETLRLLVAHPRHDLSVYDPDHNPGGSGTRLAQFMHLVASEEKPYRRVVRDGWGYQRKQGGGDKGDAH